MYASKCLFYQYTKSLRPLNLHHGEALVLELSLTRKFLLVIIYLTICFIITTVGPRFLLILKVSKMR